MTIIIKSFVETLVEYGISEEKAWEKVEEATQSAKLNDEQIEAEVIENIEELKELLGFLGEVIVEKVGKKENE